MGLSPPNKFEILHYFCGDAGQEEGRQEEKEEFEEEEIKTRTAVLFFSIAASDNNFTCFEIP